MNDKSIKGLFKENWKKAEKLNSLYLCAVENVGQMLALEALFLERVSEEWE